MNRQQMAARTCEHIILAQRIGGASGSIQATSRRRRNENHVAPLFKLPLFKLLFVTGFATVPKGRSGREAIAAFDREAFDAVLMDVQMPDMSGLEATAAIRERERQAGRGHVWIVAMTAHAMKGDRERCLDAGMDGYLAKPIERRSLFDALEQRSTGVEPSEDGNSNDVRLATVQRSSPRRPD
jgi:CheY-like chemotaxis protein